MKHPVLDRILILLCALCALCGAGIAVALIAGRITFLPVIEMMQRAALMGLKTKVVLVIAAIVLVLLAVLLIAVTLPSKKKRSSNFAIQRNENGMVRISLKALETLVQKCLNQHAELKVVTSSLYSDEESIRVDVHISLQSDISMPLAISALQKQIKKYLEACSGVMVQEVRVFVDGTIPATEETAQSPYAIPMSLLGMDTSALPSGKVSEDPQIVPEETNQEDSQEAEPAQEIPSEENAESKEIPADDAESTQAAFETQPEEEIGDWT